jgi:hypothetical protein
MDKSVPRLHSPTDGPHWQQNFATDAHVKKHCSFFPTVALVHVLRRTALLHRGPKIDQCSTSSSTVECWNPVSESKPPRCIPRVLRCRPNVFQPCLVESDLFFSNALFSEQSGQISMQQRTWYQVRYLYGEALQ